MTSFSKISWIKEGLKMLSEAGAASLTIQGLTLRIGVTKGSFYHHFKNRTEFVKAMLEYWENQMTTDIIEASREGKTFKEKNKMLASLLEKTKNSELEIAIRAWSLHDKTVEEFQERVDIKRLTYLKDLFLMMTDDTEKADVFSHIQYLFYIGQQQTGQSFSEDKFKFYNEALNTLFKMDINDNKL